MDFSAPRAEATRELLDVVRGRYHWSDARILEYLSKHQWQFRRFLDWVANGCNVYLRHKDADSEDLDRAWEKVPEVNFLREHGFEHAGVTIQPNRFADTDDPRSFSGIQLGQERPRDPLDPIVWNVIAHLSVWGTVFVRRCRYWSCEKFFRPLTKRKRFCSDSCRALAHVPDEDLHPEKVAAFRNKKKMWMREYRQRPEVKMRVPDSKATRPRRRSKKKRLK